MPQEYSISNKSVKEFINKRIVLVIYVLVLHLVQHKDELYVCVYVYDNIKTYGYFCMPIIIDSLIIDLYY